MKKVLIVASVASCIDQFNMPNIMMLKELGYEVHVACNFIEGNNCSQERINLVKEKFDSLGIVYYQIDFARNVFNLYSNFIAYKQVRKIISNNKFDLVHCHTPIGGVIARLTARSARKKGTKVIYTAHGFHFFKGAPLINWLIYYPVEKLFSYCTDTLITINYEDFELAQKKMKAKKVIYIPGVGVDVHKYSKNTVDKQTKRQELGVPNDSTMLLSIGELNSNKNHETVIRAIADLNDVYYIIAGKGKLHEYLQDMINELGLADRVKLLGFRRDIAELCEVSDAFVFPSFREGLSVSVMEAMASGLPIACSRIRGNTDLVDEDGGMLFDPSSVEDCKNAIKNLLTKDLNKIGNYNSEKIKEFGLDKVNEKMSEIYSY